MECTYLKRQRRWRWDYYCFIFKIKRTLKWHPKWQQSGIVSGLTCTKYFKLDGWCCKNLRPPRICSLEARANSLTVEYTHHSKGLDFLFIYLKKKFFSIFLLFFYYLLKLFFVPTSTFCRHYCILLYCSRRTVFGLRPYHAESTGSRPITEVKPRRAWLVLGWATA